MFNPFSIPRILLLSIPLLLLSCTSPAIPDLVERAQQAQERGDYAQAGSLWHQVLKQDPINASAYNSLGKVLALQGKSHAAIHAYRVAVALDPDWAEAYYNLGHALYTQGHREEALQVYYRARTLDPKWPETHKLNKLN